MGLETPSCKKKPSSYRIAYMKNVKHLSSWGGKIKNTDNAVWLKLEDSGCFKDGHSHSEPVLTLISSRISFKYFYHIKLLVVKASLQSISKLLTETSLSSLKIQFLV